MRSLKFYGVCLCGLFMFFTFNNCHESNSTEQIPKSQQSSSPPPTISFKIVNRFPHNSQAFTQGLLLHKGRLFESTGGWGTSSIREVDLSSGRILRIRHLPGHIFGEGIALLNNKLYQLTWKSGIVYVFDSTDFQLLRQFKFSRTFEGWGMTTDEQHLIVSDGSPRIYFLDPETFRIKNYIDVHDQRGPILNINELEFINGVLYANVWQTHFILRINAIDGEVMGVLDLKSLVPRKYRHHSDNVLNGIAYDEKSQHLFVTGKLWSTLYELEITLSKEK